MEQRCITPAIASVHSFSVLHVGEWLMKQSLNCLVDDKMEICYKLRCSSLCGYITLFLEKKKILLKMSEKKL